MSPEGKTLLNVIVLGLGFMVMFTAFSTCGNIEVGFELFTLGNARADKYYNIRCTYRLIALKMSSMTIKPTFSPFQQTVIKSFNSTEFHGSGYTRYSFSLFLSCLSE